MTKKEILRSIDSLIRDLDEWTTKRVKASLDKDDKAYQEVMFNLEGLAADSRQELTYLRDFINSLPEEPVSKDLEKASLDWLIPQLDEFYAKYGDIKMMELTRFDGYAMLDAIEFGARWQKEQMMKTAVNGKIYDTQTRSKLKAATIGKISRLKYRVGDKVKLIILKED